MAINSMASKLFNKLLNINHQKVQAAMQEYAFAIQEEPTYKDGFRYELFDNGYIF